MKASEIAEGITMTRIVCVGITVLDRIWYLDDLPKEGGKYVAKDYTEVGGGPAATAAVAAAKLGAEVDFIGRVGDDDTGRRLLAELESLGVKTRYTRVLKGPDRHNRRCWWTQAGSA
jgi:sulfofructose kinase